MRYSLCFWEILPPILLFLLNAPLASAADILQSSGFTNCAQNSDVQVKNANITFDRGSGVIFFDISGSSALSQKVNASLTVTAYGNVGKYCSNPPLMDYMLILLL